MIRTLNIWGRNGTIPKLSVQSFSHPLPWTKKQNFIHHPASSSFWSNRKKFSTFCLHFENLSYFFCYQTDKSMKAHLSWNTTFMPFLTFSRKHQKNEFTSEATFIMVFLLHTDSYLLPVWFFSSVAYIGKITHCVCRYVI